MKNQKRIVDYGINIGEMKHGERNSITDVKGVTVGHVTLDDGDIKTGVTAILPHEGNIFRDKVFGAVHIINGFGKTAGTVQIDELGTIETPILLTNTLSVGAVSDGLIEYMLDQNEDIGLTTGTVNPVVCECNDGEWLNDIRGRHVKKEHVFEAIKNADVEFEEGGVGAGTGMSCHRLKGGIGTSSRILNLDGKEYTLGALVLTNQGQKRDLVIKGKPVGKAICKIDDSDKLEKEKGSIIIILATDIPMTERQLKRIAKRAVIGLARTGSHIGHGSGEIAIAFSTANRVSHYDQSKILEIKMFNPNDMELAIRAAAECVEESVLNALITAKTTVGRNGNTRKGLNEYVEELINQGLFKDEHNDVKNLNCSLQKEHAL